MNGEQSARHSGRGYFPWWVLHSAMDGLDGLDGFVVCSKVGYRQHRQPLYHATAVVLQCATDCQCTTYKFQVVQWCSVPMYIS